MIRLFGKGVGRSPLVWLISGAWGLLPVFASTAMAQETYFRAPLTGEKVVSYQVELPVGRAESRDFQVPSDCTAILQATSDGASRWGSQVVKSMWWKVEADCRYHSYLHRFQPSPMLQDYVSGYDFRNANLADLPLSDRCGTQPLPPHACPNSYLGTGDIRQILPRIEPGTPSEHLSREACQIENGSFRGWVNLDSDPLRCFRDERAPGFRIVNIDYADVNGDGFQDAILRMMPLGPRLDRSPAVLPVTRKAMDQPFFIPKSENIAVGQAEPG